jgi:hypothetical protein
MQGARCRALRLPVEIQAVQATGSHVVGCAGPTGRIGAARVIGMRYLSLIRYSGRIPGRSAIVATTIIGALVLVSSVTSAQGSYGGGAGGMGGPGGRQSQGGGNNPPLARNVLDPHTEVLLKAMDPDNPIAVILAAKNDLKLTDSQTTVMYKIHDTMVQEQNPARIALDTLGPNPSMKSIDFLHLTTEGRDSLIAHRKAVAAANGVIHDAARSAQEKALAVLSPDQQKQLLDLEVHLRQERDLPHDTGSEQYTKPGGSSH